MTSDRPESSFLDTRLDVERRYEARCNALVARITELERDLADLEARWPSCVLCGTGLPTDGRCDHVGCPSLLFGVRQDGH